ncbi:MAG: polysaccharide pyruvyl transferase family protein [Waterburya sp.]
MYLTLEKTMHIGIIGGPGYVDGSFAMSTNEAWRHCGNTGNLAFQYAITHHITSPKHYFSWNSDPKVVREVCDLIIFPAANQLIPQWNGEKAAEFIEQVNLPCLVIGLGAQASQLGETINLQEGTIRWIRAIAERSHYISVRGEYTLDVLAKLGINNAVVTGCPSNFINPNPNLGVTIEQKLQLSPRNLVITDNAGREPLKLVEQKLLNWLKLYDGSYVCQSPKEMVALARKRFDEIDPIWLKKINEYLLPHLSSEEFIVFVKHYFRTFFDIGAWLEFLSSVDLTIGTRLHGNMLSVQSATPGICIYHDSRTNELCNTVLIPHVSVDQFMAARDIKELVDLASFDGYSFDKNRRKLAYEYKNILAKNGVEINNYLCKLATLDTNQELLSSNALQASSS